MVRIGACVYFMQIDLQEDTNTVLGYTSVTMVNEIFLVHMCMRTHNKNT